MIIYRTTTILYDKHMLYFISERRRQRLRHSHLFAFKHAEHNAQGVIVDLDTPIPGLDKPKGLPSELTTKFESDQHPDMWREIPNFSMKLMYDGNPFAEMFGTLIVTNAGVEFYNVGYKSELKDKGVGLFVLRHFINLFKDVQVLTIASGIVLSKSAFETFKKCGFQFYTLGGKPLSDGPAFFDDGKVEQCKAYFSFNDLGRVYNSLHALGLKYDQEESLQPQRSTCVLASVRQRLKLLY